MNYPVEQGMTPRVGAQFFINPEDTLEDCRKHFALMRCYGIRLVRLFILWDHVEPRPDEWHFERYDAIYSLAHTYQIQIVSTLTAEDPPRWFEEKPFYHHYADLNRSDLRKAAARYLSQVVSRYHSHPAHYAWILMNEPELHVNQNPETMQLFRTWLVQKYGMIEKLNAKWYAQFSRFEDITLHLPETPEYWQCFGAFTDWHAFLKENLVQQLGWIRDEIRKIDTVSPTHINPKGFYGNLAPVGQDYFKEAAVSDILGASIHPAWKFLWFSREEYGLAFSFCVDLIRSAARKKSFWVTELQAGPTITTGVQPCTPSPKEITAWLWDAFGAGAKAVIYWMWHPRTSGQEGGEWGIVSADHKIPKRLLASAEVSRLLESEQQLFSNAESEKPRTAIFYNQAAEVLSLIEGSPIYRTQDAPVQAMCGIYHALMRAHIPVGFVDADAVRKGALSEYRAVYFPCSSALDADILEIVRDYAADGGAVWAEAPFAMKGSDGVLHRRMDAFYQMFGIDITEFEGAAPLASEKSPYLCSADLESRGAEIVGRFSDGRPSVLIFPFGRGETCFVNSTASLGYFHSHLPVFKEQIVSFAQRHTKPLFQIHTDSEAILYRAMQSGAVFVLILENWTNEETVCSVTTACGNFSAIQCLTGNAAFSYCADKLNLTLQAKDTAVLTIHLAEKTDADIVSEC